MADRQRPKVGEILVRAGVIDNQQLRAALGEQTRWGGHLGSTLIKLGFVEEKDLVRALASQLDLPMATLEGKRIPSEVLALVPREVADRERVLPLFIKREAGRVFLFVGIEDPGNLEAFDDLAFRTGMLIKPVMVAPSELFEAIDRCYHRTTHVEPDPRTASRVTPGTEELARHWSQSSDLSDTTNPMLGEPVAEVPAPVVAQAVQPPVSRPAVVQITLDAPVRNPGVAEATAPAADPLRESEFPAGPRQVPDAARLGLVVRALSEMLIEKGVVCRDELAEKIRDLELTASGRD
jgi:hypothetical protein